MSLKEFADRFATTMSPPSFERFPDDELAEVEHLTADGLAEIECLPDDRLVDVLEGLDSELADVLERRDCRLVDPVEPPRPLLPSSPSSTICMSCLESVDERRTGSFSEMLLFLSPASTDDVISESTVSRFELSRIDPTRSLSAGGGGGGGGAVFLPRLLRDKLD